MAAEECDQLYTGGAAPLPACKLGTRGTLYGDSPPALWGRLTTGLASSVGPEPFRMQAPCLGVHAEGESPAPSSAAAPA